MKWGWKSVCCHYIVNWFRGVVVKLCDDKNLNGNLCAWLFEKKGQNSRNYFEAGKSRGSTPTLYISPQSGLFLIVKPCFALCAICSLCREKVIEKSNKTLHRRFLSIVKGNRDESWWPSLFPFDYVAVLKLRDLCSANELVKAVVCYLRKIKMQEV